MEPETSIAQQGLQELPLSGPYLYYKGTTLSDQEASYIKTCHRAMERLEERHNGAYERAFQRCPELKAVMREGMHSLLCAFDQKRKETLRASGLKPPADSECNKANDDRIRVVVFQFEERLNQFLERFGARLKEQNFNIAHLMDPGTMLGAPVDSCMRAMMDVHKTSSGVPRDYAQTAPLLLREMGFIPAGRTPSIPRLSLQGSCVKKGRWIDRCDRNEYPPARIKT